jgi:hypothetical protein
MANTFKVFTIADVAIDTGTYSTIYTCAGSTTGTNDTANEDVILVNEVIVPANTTLEVMSGQKIVIETTDVITIGAEAGSSIDATLSMMEIT